MFGNEYAKIPRHTSSNVHCRRQFISPHYFMKGFISMDINLELYKVFYYVATTLSFSEASRQLFISQSAVSQSIKTLEKKLNHPLFIRSTKKVLLTPEGELLLQHVKPALQLLDEGESLLSALDLDSSTSVPAIRSAGIFSLIIFRNSIKPTRMSVSKSQTVPPSAVQSFWRKVRQI